MRASSSPILVSGWANAFPAPRGTMTLSSGMNSIACSTAWASVSAFSSAFFADRGTFGSRNGDERLVRATSALSGSGSKTLDQSLLRAIHGFRHVSRPSAGKDACGNFGTKRRRPVGRRSPHERRFCFGHHETRWQVAGGSGHHLVTKPFRGFQSKTPRL